VNPTSLPTEHWAHETAGRLGAAGEDNTAPENQAECASRCYRAHQQSEFLHGFPFLRRGTCPPPEEQLATSFLRAAYDPYEAITGSTRELPKYFLPVPV
jgi:hypothetical protein